MKPLNAPCASRRNSHFPISMSLPIHHGLALLPTKLPHHVPIAVARQRAKLLADLSRLKRLAFAQQYIGSTVPVLFESGIMDGFRLGVTGNFLKVGVSSHIDLTNELREVQIIGASDRWAMGQLTEGHQPMRGVPVL